MYVDKASVFGNNKLGEFTNYSLRKVGPKKLERFLVPQVRSYTLTIDVRGMHNAVLVESATLLALASRNQIAFDKVAKYLE